MCALKTISKHTLTPSGVKMVLTEQATMKETAGCPFFPGLLASFETDSEFCIVSVRILPSLSSYVYGG